MLKWLTTMLLLLTPIQAHAIDEPGINEPATLPIVFQVAIDGGINETNRIWLREHIKRANSLLRASGVVLAPSFSKLKGTKPLNLRTRADRHALGKHLSDKPVIHVFVVQSLKDVDIENKWISGVHWRPRGLPGKHFVILSLKAAPWTLTHELGHFFGNSHSETVNNIMSYEHDGKREPFFDSGQRRRIARRLKAFLTSGELVPTD